MSIHLFDAQDRADPHLRRPGESRYSFLNRARQPYWERVRVELERWFASYPREHQRDLSRRFAQDAEEQHLAAWWELYLHRLFQRSGWTVEVHPSIGGVASRPDFRITAEGRQETLVEAALTISGIVETSRNLALDHFVVAAVNAVENNEFRVALKIRRSGAQAPARRRITQPIQRWLDGLDPAATASLPPDARPTLPLSFDGWEIIVRPVPLPRADRPRDLGPMVAFGPSSGGYVDDEARLRATLEKKRRQHGRPAVPLVIAVLLASPTFDRESVENALFGPIAWRFDPDSPQSGQWVRQPDGFWINGARPHGTRVSAVITGRAILPSTVANKTPRIWLNPFAERPWQRVDDQPLSVTVVTPEGAIVHHDAGRSGHEIFGLPEGWPGGEPPALPA